MSASPFSFLCCSFSPFIVLSDFTLFPVSASVLISEETKQSCTCKTWERRTSWGFHYMPPLCTAMQRKWKIHRGEQWIRQGQRKIQDMDAQEAGGFKRLHKVCVCLCRGVGLPWQCDIWINLQLTFRFPVKWRLCVFLWSECSVSPRCVAGLQWLWALISLFMCLGCLKRYFLLSSRLI